MIFDNDKGVYKREMAAFSAMLENKLKVMQSKYTTDYSKLQKQIGEYAVKPPLIDIQPSYQIG